ncbi:PfkB family carbohydrate kinase [Mariniluteicoccus endophyticus]
MEDVLCVGDNIIDRYLDEGLMCPGGNCLNVAVQAARLGAEVAYVGSVGDDVEGAWVLGAARDEGVDVSRVVTRQGRTGYADITRTDGERLFGDFDRGVSRFRPEPGWVGELPAARILHTSYSSGLEDEVEELRRHAEVSFDFDTHIGDAYCLRLLPHVRHAFFSGSATSQQAAAEFVRSVVAGGALSATVTRGAEGAVHATAGGVFTASAHPVQVRDTLGAGDAYIAGVLVGLVRREDPEAYLARAAEVAAGVCGSLGGFGHSRSLREPAV